MYYDVSRIKEATGVRHHFLYVNVHLFVKITFMLFH